MMLWVLQTKNAWNGGMIMNNELESIWRKLWAVLRYYYEFCLEGLKKITKTFQNGQFPEALQYIKEY